MTEYFRITGKNLIDFDRQTVSTAEPIYKLLTGRPPRGISKPLTRMETVSALMNLPLGVRGHALNRGMSTVTFPFAVETDTDAAMEQALHDLKETLREGQLFIESEGQRGTQALLRYQMNNASESSYKTIYCGRVEEAGAREILGSEVKEQYIEGLQLTLYMEPMWRPSAAIALGPNEILCPGFEEDGNADGLADNWTAMGAPACTMDYSHALQGFYCQRLVSGAVAWQGVQSTVIVAPAGVTSCIAYAWIARPAAGSNIIVEVYDSTAAAWRGSASYDTAGWETALGKDGTTTFYRVEVPVAAGLVAGNNHRLRIQTNQAVAATFYVDKVFWLWNQTTVPDEWCDHWKLYNHYDTTEGAAHEGHQNYFDVCDLKGTDEARLLIVTEADIAADEAYFADLITARRNWWEETHASTMDNHWLEGEDASKVNWAALGGLARCSAGDCVSNNANVTGSLTWQFFAIPGLGQYSAQAMRGRFDVFGMVYTDDEVNTQYRLSYSNFGALVYFYNKWIKQPDDSQWQMIYLGEVNFDKFLRGASIAGLYEIVVEYEKDAADTVRLDCIWLLPKADPETRLHTVDDDWLSTSLYWVIDRMEDFDYEEKEELVGAQYETGGELCLQGDVPVLTPNRVDGQRLYFCCESVDTTPAPDERIWEAHGAATNLQFRVDMSYMPQYQTPLD